MGFGYASGALVGAAALAVALVLACGSSSDGAKSCQPGAERLLEHPPPRQEQICALERSHRLDPFLLAEPGAQPIPYDACPDLCDDPNAKRCFPSDGYYVSSSETPDGGWISARADAAAGDCPFTTAITDATQGRFMPTLKCAVSVPCPGTGVADGCPP